MKKNLSNAKLKKSSPRTIAKTKKSLKPLTNKSGNVRELKADDIRAMKSAKEMLPQALLDVLPKRKRGERGEQKKPKKVLVTTRYSQEVVVYFKSTGQGWQTLIDKVLRNYIKEHPLKEYKSPKH